MICFLSDLLASFFPLSPLFSLHIAAKIMISKGGVDNLFYRFETMVFSHCASSVSLPPLLPEFSGSSSFGRGLFLSQVPLYIGCITLFCDIFEVVSVYCFDGPSLLNCQQPPDVRSGF